MATRAWMLPGEKRRTARDWIVDAVMLAIALGVGAIVLGESESAHSGDEMVFFDLVLGLAALVPLWWRRRYPFAVAVITILPGFVSGMAAGAGLIGLFNVALRGSRRAIAVSAALTIVGGAVYPLLYPNESSYAIDLALAVLFPAVVIPWGLFARAQRDLLRGAQERARRLEAEQRLHMEHAREAERRRIAGEMHDVLAHRLSLLSVHAGALEFRPDAPPEEISEAAGVIRATAHDALRDLREVIGVLRAGDGGAGPPQPTLAELPALIDESRAAGMDVRARISASGGDELRGRTAYRIVQEGLTNARKHAPGAPVEVTVTDGLVEVVSRRAGAATPPPGAGSGLIGLAERVALAGGTLEHGPDERGDFVLRARL